MMKEQQMQYAGVLEGEETASGALPDGRRVYVRLDVYRKAPTPERLNPLYWQTRLEYGDFDDRESPPVVWMEGAKVEGVWRELTREDFPQFFAPGSPHLFRGYDWMLYCHNLEFHLMTLVLETRRNTHV